MDNSIDLKKHVLSTYLTLRVGLAGAAIFLPFFLWWGGHYLFDVQLKKSMSAYYHEEGLLRDVFVGILMMVAAFLYLYKGFTQRENIALNLAGLFLAVVALVPTAKPGIDVGQFTLHGASALFFFLAIGYVALFRANDTLPLMKDRVKAKRFAWIYRIVGAAMIASPLIAFVLVLLFGTTEQGGSSWVFFFEAVSVVVFGLYWIFKTLEVQHTHAEQRALEGSLRVAPAQSSELFKAAQVEPAS
ncbi:MAG: hypothetical protein AAGA21_02135 [Pseudomonadota bacterium]